MLMFRSCPKCKGDRYVEGDVFGPYLLCLQCGHVSYPGTASMVRSRPADRRPSEHSGMPTANALLASR